MQRFLTRPTTIRAFWPHCLTASPTEVRSAAEFWGNRWGESMQPVALVRGVITFIVLSACALLARDQAFAQDKQQARGTNSLRNASICYVGTYTNRPAK